MTSSAAHNPPAQLDVLHRGHWFAALPDDARQALLAVARTQSLAPAQRLFSRGDANDGLYAVLQGAVRVGAVAPSGREALLGVIVPGQWFGEIATLDGGLRTHDAVAQGQTKLLHVPLERLLAVLEAHPTLWRYLGQLVAEKLRAVFSGMEDLVLLPAPARVARRLLAMAQGHGMWQADAAVQTVQVQQDQLGAMLALTRQTVSEVLGDFEARGWLKRRRGCIDLLDPAALAQHADRAG
ncbi:Crp/Fnr family transcriptional regulator [Ideonella margarita]|uniref:Crp/Fnr family transcriptional regulator n=1 Tax=Ideonella margarita TaxID=2984191 RepID=A0ABU9C6A7_9BURK